MNLVTQKELQDLRVFIYNDITFTYKGNKYQFNLTLVDKSVDNVRQRILKKRESLIQTYGEDLFGKLMAAEPLTHDMEHGRIWTSKI